MSPIHVSPGKATNSWKWLAPPKVPSSAEDKRRCWGGESAMAGDQEKHRKTGEGGYTDLRRCLLHEKFLEVRHPHFPEQWGGRPCRWRSPSQRSCLSQRALLPGFQSLSPCPLASKTDQPKWILMPKRHVLGWQVLFRHGTRLQTWALCCCAGRCGQRQHSEVL